MLSIDKVQVKNFASKDDTLCYRVLSSLDSLNWEDIFIVLYYLFKL